MSGDKFENPANQQKEKTSPTESRLHPEYPDYFIVAIKLINQLKPQLTQIEELSDSPLFEVSSQIFNTEGNNTMLPAQGAKQLFPKIWDHFYDMIGIPVDMRSTKDKFMQKAISAMESMFVRGRTKPAEQFIETSLIGEERRAIANETISQNNIARLGGVHEQRRFIQKEKSKNIIDYIQDLKVTYAIELREYLCIQKDWAGMGKANEKPTEAYIIKTKQSALAILNDIKDNGWDKYASPDIVTILNEQVPVTEEMIQQKIKNATHDLNLISDDSPNARQIFNDPDLKTGDLKGLRFTLFSSSGKKYKLTNIQDILKLSPKKILEKSIIANSVHWIDIPNPSSNSLLPQTYFALSLDTSPNPNSTQTFKSIRGARGRTTHHFHLEIKDKFNILHKWTSHRGEDGQIAKFEIDQDENTIDVQDSKIPYEVIELNPYFPNDSPNVTNRLVQDKLQLTDTTIHFDLYEPENIENALALYNKEYIDPVNEKIKKILRNPETYELLNQIMKDNNIKPSVETARKSFLEIQKILNPKLSRHTLFGLVLELDGPTANCTFPYQSYTRLNFSQFIRENIINKLKSTKKDDRIEVQDFNKLIHAIKMSLVSQSLAKLGVNPLNYLAVYTHANQELAINTADIISKQASDKSQVFYQLSELGKGKAKFFISALSQTVGSLYGAIGLINNHISFRLNLTHDNAHKTITSNLIDISDNIEKFKPSYYPLPKELQINKNEEQSYNLLTSSIGNSLKSGISLREIILELENNKSLKLTSQEIDKYLRVYIVCGAYNHYSQSLYTLSQLCKVIQKKLVNN